MQIDKFVELSNKIRADIEKHPTTYLAMINVYYPRYTRRAEINNIVGRVSRLIRRIKNIQIATHEHWYERKVISVQTIH